MLEELIDPLIVTAKLALSPSLTLLGALTENVAIGNPSQKSFLQNSPPKWD